MDLAIPVLWAMAIPKHPAVWSQVLKWICLLGLFSILGCGGPQRGVFCGQSDIVRIIEANQTAVQGCYAAELRKNGQLRGKVVMNWRIGLDGKTRKVKVDSSTLKNKPVEDCLVRQLKGAHFPKPNGGMCQIRHPFFFSSGVETKQRAPRVGSQKQSNTQRKKKRGPFCKKADLLKVVKSNVSTLQACYERELVKHPKLTGKVILSWRMGLDGTVGKSVVESSTLDNKPAEDCMAAALKE